MSLLRMNWSFCTVSKSVGSLMMILSAPFSWRQRQDDVFAGHRFGHQFDDGGGDGDLGEVDELHAVELGDGAHAPVRGWRSRA